MPTIQAKATRLARRARLTRWLGRGLETHVALPVFAVLLLAAMWLLTLRFVGSEHEAAAVAAHTATQERLDTYEAQMARSLNGIDQTLKVLKYAVEMKGTQGAIPALREQGLLPPGLVFVVAVADRSGRIVASNPDEGALDVSNAAYFLYHRDNDEGEPFVSATVADPVKAEPHLHFTRRIEDAAGRFAGIAIVEVEPAYFTSAYEHARDGAHGMLGLAGLDGVMRALRIGDTISWGQRIELGHGVPGATQGSIALRHGTPDGVARYTAIQRLHGFPLAIVVGLAQDEQFAPYEAARRTWLLVAAGASALLLLVVALISLWSWQLAKARRRAHRAQETYAAASEGSLDAFCVFRTVRDARGRVDDFEIEATNSKAEEIFGMTSEELHGKRLCTLLPHYRKNGIFDDMAEVVHTGQAREGEWQASAVAAVGRWLHRQVVPVEDGIVVIVRDITERKRAEERIFHMAHHDELTGLPNRNLMHDRIDQAIRNAARAGTGVALAFVDLDGFKLVNDGLGHKAGDELLKVVSRRMGACLRRNDTLARFGGDEFVILLPDQAHDPLALSPLLEKIRVAVTEPVQVAGQAVQVSCSMGVVMYPRDGADASALLMNADAAMYRAKDLGSNNFQFYAREMNASVEEKLMLLDGLRHAVQETVDGHGDSGNRFHLLYQPKVDLKTGRIFGVEALIRWHHPEHGVVSPQRFIGLAEESGLIVQIGEWVVRTACQQARTWLACGLPPITVSVNVSARQFEESRLVERVAAALQDSGLPSELLELEVTESLIMRDLQKAVDKMRELKAMGVSLSVDDFGTGYSSLSALKSFPISRLKIDKSFVSELADNPDDQAIAMAVISLGHKLNLKVIAEGVETEQQCAFLRANECDEMQGYLFSKPVTAGEIEDMVEQYVAKPGSCARLSLVASQPQAALALAG